MFIPYHKNVYRNFATLIESQELVDDLTNSTRRQNILNKFFYPDLPIPSSVERVMNRSLRQIILNEINSKFNPLNWYYSRYSDGTWPVLYTAESEQTALQEALYHLKQFYKEELLQKDIWVDRRVIRLKIRSSKCVDLAKQKNVNQKKLIFQTQSGYPYCQKLAKKLIDQGAELLKVPSARDEKGVCVPIFTKKIIWKDEGHLKYLKCLLKKDGNMDVYEPHFPF